MKPIHEGGSIMTQTDDLIKKFTKERPGLDKKIAHYDEQF